ncbi:hypothetical protein GCM10010336_72370 [Streptomyces goshikiensis]|nr:hypothetical protein GCM10010336_72370 [Streptomyces goshikiensis]
MGTIVGWVSADTGVEEEQSLVALHEMSEDGSTRACGPPVSDAGRTK